MRFLLVFLSFFFACTSYAQIQVEKAWVRATAPGAKVAGGYMVMRNTGAAADRLLSASSPAAAKVELHVHLKEGEIVKMRQVPAYDIPANATFELKPGGAHLMFLDIKRPFKEGEKVPVKLKFEKAGEVSAEFHVGRLGESAAPAAHQKH